MKTLKIKGDVNWENLLRIKVKKHGWHHALNWVDKLWLDGRICDEECKRLGEIVLGCPTI